MPDFSVVQLTLRMRYIPNTAFALFTRERLNPSLEFGCLRPFIPAVFVSACRLCGIALTALIAAFAANAQNFPLVPNPTPNTHYEMLYNPADGLLYVYTPGTGSLLAPTLVSQVDPKTATVLKTVSLIFFSLDNFELSPAGDYLYVKGFQVSGEAVLRYHLPDFQLDARYSLPTANAPHGLAVSPSDSHVYAVAQESFSAGHTVQLFRDGAQIGTSVSLSTSAGSLIFLSDSRLVELAGTGLLEYTVSSGGLSWDGIVHTIVYAGDRPTVRNNRLYTTTGLSIDTNNWNVLGSFVRGIQFEPSFGLSPGGDTSYYSLGTNVVGAFATDTFKLTGTVTVPNGIIQAVVSCGSDILAISKNEGIYLAPLSSVSPVTDAIPVPSTISPEGVQVLALQAMGIAYDKNRHSIYAVAPNSAGPTGNSVVLIDPATAIVKNYAFVGSDPSQIVVSDSGNAIHVALYGARSVATVDPLSLATRRVTPLSDTNSSAVFPPGWVAAVPGSDTAFAVSRDSTYAVTYPSPFPATVAYDNGLPLPAALKNTGAPLLAGTIAGQVFQWDSVTIQRLFVDAGGVHVDQQQSNTLTDSIGAIYDNTIYTLAGNVYQFGNTQPQAHFTVNGRFASLALSPDGAILYLAVLNPGCYSLNQSGCSPGLGFYPGSVVQLTAMDRKSLAILGQYRFTLPDGSINLPIAPMAVATDNEIFLNFRGLLVTRVPLTALTLATTTPSCAASGFSLSPNPLLAAPFTTARFTGTVNCPYEIRNGSASGPVVASGPAGNIAVDASGVIADRDTFYLQPAGITTAGNTLASVTAQVRDALVASCTVSQFSINPSPIFSDAPYAAATLSGNVGCDYDIHVGSPDGSLFASGAPGRFSVKTGNWVTNNLVFYLQARGYQSAAGTLATAIAKIRPITGSSCTASDFGANPNPIRTNGIFGSTVLTGTVGCSYDIRVGSASGAVFASGMAGDISASTGNWVTDGMAFFLQARGDGSDAGTLAVFTARLQPAGPSSCLVHGLTANPNPIRTDALFGATTLVGTSDCAYDIRLGSPSGPLFTTGASGNISVQTGDWVTDGLMFYVQAHDDTTPLGTLGLVTAHVIAGAPAACTVSGFAIKDSPVRSNTLFGATTVEGSVDCAYDIRVGTPDGALFASGDKGVISMQTGNWVTDGLTFYLQPSGNTGKASTLAVATARLQPQGSSCTVGSFTANLFSNSDSYGSATLTGNVGCDYDIRVGGPSGALFTSGGKGAISANTSDWVTDGLLFYLQARGNTSPEGTLAVAKATAP